jgi:outer membrane lipoprotein-sorting protein
MKRILICIAALLASAAMLTAQTPEEIIARMDEEMNKADKMGLAVTMDIKIPIIGSTSARMYTLGEKNRTEMSIKDIKSTLWMDNTTMWTYTPSDNELVIENRTSTSGGQEDNLGLMKGITAGYDVNMTKETADAWYFDCKKSKTNTDKDDPKKMTLVVDKKTYLPKELSTKAKGVTISMKDAVLGVTESEVTYDPSKIPAGVKVTDKR